MSEENNLVEEAEINEDDTIKTEGDTGNDIYSMSDEDFLTNDVQDIHEPVSEEPQEEPEEEEEDTPADDTPEEEEAPQEAPEESEATEEVEDTSTEAKDDATIGEEAQLSAMFGTIRANGKDVKLKSMDEARQLMSMGMGYSKRMSQLKPNLKLMKMLENNDLLDEGKLSYLIDLDKKDPTAIKRLVKDSGLDSYELGSDDEEQGAYTPNTYTVDDTQLELDNVLNELEGTPAFSTTIEVVGNKWDDASKQAIMKEPSLLRAINTHVENGVYQRIVDETERRKMLGELQNMSDIDAYKAVGNHLEAAGAFKDIAAPAGTRQNQQAQQQQAQAQAQLNEQRKAVSAPKRTKKVAAKKKAYDPLAMSDEEFAKINNLSF